MRMPHFAVMATVAVGLVAAPLRAAPTDAPTGSSPANRPGAPTSPAGPSVTSPAGPSRQDLPPDAPRQRPLDVHTAASPDAPVSGLTTPGLTARHVGSTLSAVDQEFVQQAAVGGLAEVAAGRLALQKSQNTRVKQFAQQMVTDHTAANAALQRLATPKGLTLPAKPDAKHEAAVKDLAAKDGTKFDRAYMLAQVQDHLQVISVFQREAAQGGDTELKSWAQQTLPKLRHHLQMAEEILRAAPGGA